MGLRDGLRSLGELMGPVPETLSRDEGDDGDYLDPITEAIYADIEARRRAFTIEQARRLPAVIRAKTLLCGVSASFAPLAYRDREALDPQPRFTRKPDPFGSRFDFLYQTVDAMVECCAFWLLADHDDQNFPRSAVVIPHDEVEVRLDERTRLLRRYHWRGRELTYGTEIVQLAIGRRPGETHGRGPLKQMLDSLYPVQAAEDYAAGFFGSGGIPMTVIKAAGPITDTEAATIKARYVAARAEVMGAPAVLGSTLSAEWPNVDPQRGQMQEARSYGATVVSRGLGIPGALMHVETSGATITYTNPAGALEELVKTTVAPLYLAPIEAAWSELVPSPQAIRFDLADLQRADMAARFAIYGLGIDKGIMTSEEARNFEGWRALGAGVEAGHAFDAVPSRVPSAEAGMLSEVKV